MADSDCVPTLPSGISGRTRIIRLAGSDCVPTLPSGISGRTRIIRLATGDCVPDPLTGIWGRTRIIRRKSGCAQADPCVEAYPGDTLKRYCFHDDFDRTVEHGAGEGPCGAWDADIGADEPGYPPDDMFVTPASGLVYLSGYNSGWLETIPLSTARCVVVAVSIGATAEEVGADYVWDPLTMDGDFTVYGPGWGYANVTVAASYWTLTVRTEAAKEDGTRLGYVSASYDFPGDFHPTDFFFRASFGRDGTRAKVWDQEADEPADWQVENLPVFPYVSQNETIALEPGWGWWESDPPPGARDHPSINWKVTGMAVCCGEDWWTDDRGPWPGAHHHSDTQWATGYWNTNPGHYGVHTWSPSDPQRGPGGSALSGYLVRGTEAGGWPTSARTDPTTIAASGYDTGPMEHEFTAHKRVFGTETPILMSRDEARLGVWTIPTPVAPQDGTLTSVQITGHVRANNSGGAGASNPYMTVAWSLRVWEGDTGAVGQDDFTFTGGTILASGTVDSAFGGAGGTVADVDVTYEPTGDFVLGLVMDDPDAAAQQLTGHIWQYFDYRTVRLWATNDDNSYEDFHYTLTWDDPSGWPAWDPSTEDGWTDPQTCGEGPIGGPECR